MTNIPTPRHPTLIRRPRVGTKMPEVSCPLRRFVARYAIQALCDYYWPPKNLELEDWLSAREFLHSGVGQEIIHDLGIPITRIRQILEACHE